MNSSKSSVDALFEELITIREEEDAMRPPYGGYNGGHTRWLGWQYHADNGKDILYKNREGQLHRIYGPAYISKKYDIEIWYKDGKMHRIDGPAVRHKRNLLWYVEGKLHRLDGPAIIDLGGPKQYWIDGVKFSRKQYKWEIQRRKRRQGCEKKTIM